MYCSLEQDYIINKIQLQIEQDCIINKITLMSIYSPFAYRCIGLIVFLGVSMGSRVRESVKQHDSQVEPTS